MARSAARLNMGHYPLPESEGAKLRELLTFTGPASVVDPCVGQGTALNLLTQGAEVRRYGVELDAERAMAAGAKGIETIQGNAFDAIAKPESFSLLYQREAGQFSWRARMLQHRSRTVYFLHSPDAGLPGSDNMVLRLSRLTTTSDKL
jgi:hypothetical protein